VLLFQNYPGMAWFPIPCSESRPFLLGLCSWVVWWEAVGVVGWLLVENCTVDASILFSVG